MGSNPSSSPFSKTTFESLCYSSHLHQVWMTKKCTSLIFQLLSVLHVLTIPCFKDDLVMPLLSSLGSTDNLIFLCPGFEPSVSKTEHCTRDPTAKNLVSPGKLGVSCNKKDRVFLYMTTYTFKTGGKKNRHLFEMVEPKNTWKKSAQGGKMWHFGNKID